MAKNVIPAPAVVRAWAVEQGLLPAEGTKGARRGRLGTSVIDAWNADPSHRGQKYPVNYRPKSGPSVKHTVVVDRGGKNRPITRSLPVSVVRERAVALGVAKSRGKFTKAALDAVFTEAANAPKA